MSDVKCPNCGLNKLQQQLNHFYVCCLACGAWFKLKEISELKYEHMDKHFDRGKPE